MSNICQLVMTMSMIANVTRNHFHGADATKGNPFSKGRYNQYHDIFQKILIGLNRKWRYKWVKQD